MSVSQKMLRSHNEPQQAAHLSDFRLTCDTRECVWVTLVQMITMNTSPTPPRLKGTQSWTTTDSCSPVCWDWRLWLCIFRCSRPHENFPWLTARESQALPTPAVPASVPAQGATRTAILPLPHNDLHGTLLRKSRSFYFKQNDIITCLCFVIYELQNIYLRGPTAASGTLSDARVKKEEAWEGCINDLLLWLILRDTGPGTVTEALLRSCRSCDFLAELGQNPDVTGPRQCVKFELKFHKLTSAIWWSLTRNSWSW